MQLRHAVLAAIVAGFALTGCQSRQQSSVDTESLKQAFVRVNPDAKVGSVAAVLEDRGLLAIEDLPVNEIELGDTLVFLDQDQAIIAAGHVVRKTDTAVHVKYSTNQKDIHPKVGDLVVKPTM